MDKPIRRHRSAIVRGVANTYDRCIRPDGGGSPPIDVGLAREQHATYCAVLEKLGIELVRLDPDDRYPDCCFVEDTAVVVGDTAVICEMGAQSRRGEETAVAAALAGRRLVHLEPPATMDGGDVIFIVGELFVGLTDRTNNQAVRSVREFLAPSGVDVTAVPVTDVLHLKSACTPVAPGLLLISEQFAATGAFAEYERLIVPQEESYAANCLSVNGTVVVSDGYPRTRTLIEERGIPTVALDMSEFRKGGGSLTCLSILL
jgi:dimethylargininase